MFNRLAAIEEMRNRFAFQISRIFPNKFDVSGLSRRSLGAGGKTLP